MKIELLCPHCNAEGVISAIPDFHPDTIFCGQCKKEFDYIPTVWEHLDDLNDDVSTTGMFYMIPIRAAAILERDHLQAMHPLEWLTALPLKYVVRAYKSRWRRGMRSDYGDNPPYDDIRLTYGPRSEVFPSAVIKGYLDGQAHVGPKGPEKAQKDLSSPTLRQGRMSYSQLKRIAERGGKIEWAKSKIQEVLFWQNGHIRAYKSAEAQDSGHTIRRHNKAYFCKEVT